MWLRIIILVIVLAVLLRFLRIAYKEMMIGLKGEETTKKKPIQSKQSDITNQYLQVLGLTTGASKEEIKQAYRERVRKYHPDTVEGMEEEFREVARRKTAELNEAYEYLIKK